MNLLQGTVLCTLAIAKVLTGKLLINSLPQKLCRLCSLSHILGSLVSGHTEHTHIYYRRAGNEERHSIYSILPEARPRGTV
jgi:hypothetical protein